MNHEYVSVAEYAARIGKEASSVKKKCQRGTLPGAVKIGRDWLIPADAPYIDAKIKTGKYIGQRKKAPAE